MAKIGTNYGVKYSTISSELTLSQLQSIKNVKNTLIVSAPDITGVTSRAVGIGITDSEGYFMPIHYSFDTDLFDCNDKTNTVSLTSTHKHNIEILSYILATDERFAVKFSSDGDRSVKVYQYKNEDNTYSYYALNNAALLTIKNNIYNNVTSVTSNFTINKISGPTIDSVDTYSYVTEYELYPKKYGVYQEPVTVSTEIGTSFTSTIKYSSSIGSTAQIKYNCYMCIADVNEVIQATYVGPNTVTKLFKNFTNFEAGLQKYPTTSGDNAYIYFYKYRNFNNELTPITIQHISEHTKSIATSNQIFDIWDAVSKYGMYNGSTSTKYYGQQRNIILFVPELYVYNGFINFSFDSSIFTKPGQLKGTFVNSNRLIPYNEIKPGETAGPSNINYYIFYYTIDTDAPYTETDMSNLLDENKCVARISTPFVEILPPDVEPAKKHKTVFMDGTKYLHEPYEGYTGDVFLLPQIPVKTGYIFKGWGTKNSSEISIYSWETDFAIDSVDMYYYAIWTKVTPTPTPTKTSSPTGSPSASPTGSPTASPTGSPTPIPTEP